MTHPKTALLAVLVVALACPLPAAGASKRWKPHPRPRDLPDVPRPTLPVADGEPMTA